MEKYKVTYDRNFIRIIKLPERYPEDYCFGGGHDFIVRIIDWFNPHDQLKLANEGNFILEGEKLFEHREEIREFIKEKSWYLPEHDYLALTSYGDIFLIDPHKGLHEEKFLKSFGY